MRHSLLCIPGNPFPTWRIHRVGTCSFGTVLVLLPVYANLGAASCTWGTWEIHEPASLFFFFGWVSARERIENLSIKRYSLCWPALLKEIENWIEEKLINTSPRRAEGSVVLARFFLFSHLISLPRSLFWAPISLYKLPLLLSFISFPLFIHSLTLSLSFLIFFILFHSLSFFGSLYW